MLREYCTVVEIAFGCLKARWRRLLKRNDMMVKNVTDVIAAACVLHNMCEVHGESFNESWSSSDSTAHSASVAIREALVHHFNN